MGIHTSPDLPFCVWRSGFTRNRWSCDLRLQFHLPGDKQCNIDQTLSLSLGYEELPRKTRLGQSLIPNSTCPHEMFFNPPSYNRGSLHTIATLTSHSFGGEGRGRPGIHCMHMRHYIIQILNNPITYRYFVIYLPFDLNSSRSTFLEMAGLDSLSFEWYFEQCCRVDRRRPPNGLPL